MIDKQFIPYAPEQTLLLPPDLHEWLPKDHLVYFILDVLQEIDLSPFYKTYKSHFGRRSYNPQMMVGLLIYSYCTGLTSSRKIEKACIDSVPFRILTSDRKPDHDTIAAFRARHLKGLSAIFIEILELCNKSGLLRLGNISIDGSKMRANASKHKAMSYDRMEKAIPELEMEIKRLLEEAERVDAFEDAKYGKGKRIDELPDDLKNRKNRLKKIREAKKALEKEAQKRREEQLKKERESGKTSKQNEKKKDTPAVPKPKAQRNFTDPESRIMRDGATKAFVQGYNSQIAVDSKNQIILVSHVTNQANDKQQIVPVIEKLNENLPSSSKGCSITADAGYFSDENIKYLEKDYDPYIATGRMKHGEDESSSVRGRMKNDITPKEKMARKLRTKIGKNIYKMRKAIVEPVFGQIKQCQGIRNFRLRGLEKVSHEWDFICATHNLLKLFRYGAIAVN